ncbi:TPA_asm: fusion protein [Ferula assa-foetida amalgavirus 1]|nr:TPA_asm: fusion protein [Ferula assa-foetida amalgavirus 1]
MTCATLLSFAFITTCVYFLCSLFYILLYYIIAMANQTGQGNTGHQASGSGTARPFHGQTSSEQLNQSLRDALEPLRPTGMPIDLFNVVSVNNANYPVSNFIKLLRAITQFNDADTLFDVMALGIKQDFFNAAQNCTVRGLIKFCQYLNSKPGREALNNIQRLKKLKRKATGPLGVEDVALAQMFTTQMVDFRKAESQVRVRYDDTIADLRRQIVQLEMERDSQLAALKPLYSPVSSFIQPLEEQVFAQAYDLYAADATASGNTPLPKTDEGFRKAYEMFAGRVAELAKVDFCKLEGNTLLLVNYFKSKILELDPQGERRKANSFAASWHLSVSKYLLRYPLPRRLRYLTYVPVGVPTPPGSTVKCKPLQEIILNSDLLSPKICGERIREGLRHGLVGSGAQLPLETHTLRVTLVRPLLMETKRSIPTARSRFEAGLRRIIAGGELVSWSTDGNMVRGGGDSHDAIRLLFQARADCPGSFLSDCFSVAAARGRLLLPEGLEVPDGPGACVMKNFNNDATSGPFLRIFGCKKKYGLKRRLESIMWFFYDGFAAGKLGPENLPFLTARVGFRTKLLTAEAAREKVLKNSTFGRAVMMLDALEQAASSPLYNALSSHTFRQRLLPECGFKNALVRASSDWMEAWKVVSAGAVIVELDWSKFDRERPRQDLEFLVDVVGSCFEAGNARERRLLDAYLIMMRRALIERPVVMDGGGVFTIDGMVPSGSLWTGWLDTALNILYIKAACTYLGIPPSSYHVMCAGDDNLTIFSKDPGNGVLLQLRVLLNEWFRAGIDAEDFLIHRPPFHVTKRQAVFPPGTDLSRGTSRILHLCRWEEFEGEIVVDVAAGRSHRWQYHFAGKPKFLSNYWLEDGRPIRPAKDNLEKLLWPEGLHTSLVDYEAAVIAMVVDNPHNHHNVNHLLSRYIIIQQIRRYGAPLADDDAVMFLSKIRDESGGPIPYPQIATWRRAGKHMRMEDFEGVQGWIATFRDFMQGVTSLYIRRAEGGLDAWKFMDIIRGDSNVGEGQFGNDLLNWLGWLHAHPITKFLSNTRSFRATVERDLDPQHDYSSFELAMEVFRARMLDRGFETAIEFACWCSDMIRARLQD